jgi:hypothetical protein
MLLVYGHHYIEFYVLCFLLLINGHNDDHLLVVIVW